MGMKELRWITKELVGMKELRRVRKSEWAGKLRCVRKS